MESSAACKINRSAELLDRDEQRLVARFDALEKIHKNVLVRALLVPDFSKLFQNRLSVVHLSLPFTTHCIRRSTVFPKPATRVSRRITRFVVEMVFAMIEIGNGNKFILQHKPFGEYIHTRTVPQDHPLFFEMCNLQLTRRNLGLSWEILRF